MTLSSSMKWLLALMREQGVIIRRNKYPALATPRGREYQFNPQPYGTRGRPNKHTVLALERRGLIALERVGLVTAYVLTEKGRAT